MAAREETREGWRCDTTRCRDGKRTAGRGNCQDEERSCQDGKRGCHDEKRGLLLLKEKAARTGGGKQRLRERNRDGLKSGGWEVRGKRGRDATSQGGERCTERERGKKGGHARGSSKWALHRKGGEKKLSADESKAYESGKRVGKQGRGTQQ
eukprot:6202725-Pleurochrysis_carterae.AAC.1